MKILIVPDKFKGTLTAQAAAQAMAAGWRKARPRDMLELLPMSDGGDGFGAVISAHLGARPQTLATLDAAHRPRRVKWWWESKRRLAIIESANIIGLARLPHGKFHPFELDTFGLGAAIREAAARGARHCIVGIGGSATNDGGFGLARSLGWKFLDRTGVPITSWTALDQLATIRAPSRRSSRRKEALTDPFATIDSSGRRRWFESLVVAVDVRNPLLGPRGCTRVYGPQKGLRPEDFATAERCLRRLAAVAKRQLGSDHAREPGVGAAGGLGFGLRCFLGACLQPGFDLFARETKLAKRLDAADLVLTGEGAIDRQTLMGKGVGQVALWSRRRNLPCLALAGTVLTNGRKGDFTEMRALTELTTADQAKRRAAHWLRKLAARVAREFGERVSARDCRRKSEERTPSPP